ASDLLNKIKQRNKSEQDYSDYTNFFSASLDIVQDGFSFVDLPFVDLDSTLEKNIRLQSAKWIYVARTAGDLYVDVRTKNYSSAVLNIITLMDTVVDYEKTMNLDKLKAELKFQDKAIQDKARALKGTPDELSSTRNKALKKLVSAFSKSIEFAESELTAKLKEAGITNAALVNSVKDKIKKVREIAAFENKGKIRERILKYGTFIALVANAQNSNEVQAAIEAIALPAGSYSVKRNTLWNISLNGYVGFGYDWGNPGNLNTEGSKIRDAANLNWGITAPVGFAFSTGTCAKKCVGSFSLFLSLIDVGSIANFRINNDTTVLTRKITVGDIFSPGATFIYGIPKMPLSISGGVMYKPALAYTYNQQNFLDVPGMFRFNISLLVDIPILNLRSRSK
ncbi:MAG: hypothetical protein IAF38_20225, partial [Bacteroidia bacterium]|nr:hypothetical protein [Bacteroidia bacterium]